VIEQAGLKGRRVGGAVVSEKHANFIVNDGGATASDIVELMALIQAEVHDRLGIVLEPEIERTGDWG
jgi:UDP-N-acetylmuramate dehydrogenase